MAYLNDIIDAVSDPRSKNRMPWCILEEIGMARLPLHNMAIVNGLNYSEKFKQLEEKLFLLESTVIKSFEEIKIETTEKKPPSSLICPTDPSILHPPVRDSGAVTTASNHGVDDENATVIGDTCYVIVVLNISGPGQMELPITGGNELGRGRQQDFYLKTTRRTYVISIFKNHLETWY